jgi:tripartite-type tricarboxylate transporter receptor subunit TctC
MRILAVILTFCALLGAQIGATAAADAYPNRPVKIICVYPAGGGLDIVMRVIGAKLSNVWGRPVIVENIAGAGTTLGAAAAAKAAPDGYTILATDISFSIAASLYDNLSYDSAKDLTPITMFARASHAIVVNPSFPVNTIGELIAYAKANPGKLLFATPGPGSIDHLGWALLNKIAGGGIVAVPYKGSPPALLDIVAGRTQAYSGATGTMVKYVTSGQLRPIAVYETERAKVLPDTPTIGEAGQPDLVMNAWYGLFAPAGTPREIIDQVNKEVAKTLDTKEVQDTLALLGNASISGVGPDDFRKFLVKDFAKWREAVAISGK